MHYYIDVLKKYAVFDGRATRKEYWMFVLISFIISFLIGLLDVSLLEVLYSLAVVLPSIGVGIRRLHDTGRSGWWLLIGIIPIIGWIVLIVFLVQDSQPDTNQYGPNPKGVTSNDSSPPASTVAASEPVISKPVEEKPQEEVVINDIPTPVQDDIVVAPEILEEKN